MKRVPTPQTEREAPPRAGEVPLVLNHSKISELLGKLVPLRDLVKKVLVDLIKNRGDRKDERSLEVEKRFVILLNVIEGAMAWLLLKPKNHEEAERHEAIFHGGYILCMYAILSELGPVGDKEKEEHKKMMLLFRDLTDGAKFGWTPSREGHQRQKQLQQQQQIAAIKRSKPRAIIRALEFLLKRTDGLLDELLEHKGGKDANHRLSELEKALLRLKQLVEKMLKLAKTMETIHETPESMALKTQLKLMFKALISELLELLDEIEALLRRNNGQESGVIAEKRRKFRLLSPTGRFASFLRGGRAMAA